MDSPHSDTLDSLARLRQCAHSGDWKSAEALAADLPLHAVPVDRAELEDYLRVLKETLIVAKAWRAHAGAWLVRLDAAAKFNSAAIDPSAGRHNFDV
jgi:hypothetical protein